MTFIRNFLLPVIVITLLFTSCSDTDDDYIALETDTELEDRIITLYGSLEGLILPDAGSFESIPSDPKNSITPEKVALGKLLFHETGLALAPKKLESMNTYSCASCHQAKAGFQSGLKQGIGEGGMGFGLFGETRVMAPDYDATTLDVQPIRSPTILNTAYQDVMLWNGQFGATKTNAGTENAWTVDTPKENNNLGFEGIETQAIAGQDVHRLKCDPEMIANSPYKALFDRAFPGIPVAERYTKLYAGLAIAAFERSVLANEAPFQEWLRGNEQALSEDEKKGALLFFGKGQCYSCHSGPGLNGMDFHALGMADFDENEVHGPVDEATKKGRGGFTNNPVDDYKFKTPTLYNLKDVHFLGHGGSFTTIEEVITYKNMAIAENTDVPETQLSPQFQPLDLSSGEIEALTAFLTEGLYDNNLARYVPESLPTGRCFPDADERARQDIGCD